MAAMWLRQPMRTSAISHSPITVPSIQRVRPLGVGAHGVQLLTTMTRTESGLTVKVGLHRLQIHISDILLNVAYYIVKVSSRIHKITE